MRAMLHPEDSPFACFGPVAARADPKQEATLRCAFWHKVGRNGCHEDFHNLLFVAEARKRYANAPRIDVIVLQRLCAAGRASPPAALARLFALLKPGGVLISSNVCLGESWVPYGALITVMRWFGKAPVVHSYDRQTVFADMRRAGFVEVEEKDVGAAKLEPSAS